VLPRAVPELAIDPGDAGDEAIGFDCTQHLTRLGTDLIDPTSAMLADPERPFCPGKPRISAVAGCGDRVEDLTCPGIDLSTDGSRDLVQVLAVACRSRIRRDVEGPHRLTALRIQGVQLVARGEPDHLPVETHPVHA